MILCIGELLADLIGKKINGSFFYERFIGGAPYNVAYGITKLGGSVMLAMIMVCPRFLVQYEC